MFALIIVRCVTGPIERVRTLVLSVQMKNFWIYWLLVCVMRLITGEVLYLLFEVGSVLGRLVLATIDHSFIVFRNEADRSNTFHFRRRYLQSSDT